MKFKVNRVRGILRFVPPRLNLWVLKCARAFAPVYLRSVLHLTVRPPLNIDTIAQEFQRFFSGSSKLILVFRHVHVHDAQVMFYLFNNLLQRHAKKRGIGYPRRPHAHFLYGRGVPVWGGKHLEWLFSRLGGIPVHHRKLDREGLDVVRRSMLQGLYPIALAPEGQVTYHNQMVSAIEPGFAQLALWARNDAEQAGQNRGVRVLPISQYFHYGEDGANIRAELIDTLSRETGLDVKTGLQNSAAVQQRMHEIGARLLSKIESFYSRYYGIYALGPHHANIRLEDCSRKRVEHLVDEILKLQERRLGIIHPPRGFTPRIYIVRMAGWNRIFVQDENNRTAKSPLDRELHDYIAAEAGLFARHLEVVDLLAYLQPEYALQSADVNRHIEFLLNLLDAVNRLEGGTIGQRVHTRRSAVSISVGTPISLNRVFEESPDKSARQVRNRLIEHVEDQFTNLAGGSAY